MITAKEARDRLISIYYYFDLDERPGKEEIVPASLKENDLLLMRWHGYEDSFQLYKASSNQVRSNHTSLQEKVENKFGVFGWFKCLKDGQGRYYKMEFGDVLNYGEWLEYVSKREIYFDSGMYAGNIRPYSQWRSDNSFWDNLVILSYSD